MELKELVLLRRRLLAEKKRLQNDLIKTAKERMELYALAESERGLGGASLVILLAHVERASSLQSLLLILAASLLSQGWSDTHTAAALLFPALLTMSPQPPLETPLLAAGPCLISSIAFTYLTIRGAVRPTPS
ncbi:hypothetical protein HRbin02_01646 [Candidatus Calditenuaceae archaeon HR02]|nr:hypothetical protein HRbin02_01646 [Candidatus Calditenuaceae archaeon HR02]